MHISMMMPLGNLGDSSYGGHSLQSDQRNAPCRPGSSVPEFYGKPSPYSAGTQFLGTPKDYLEVCSNVLPATVLCFPRLMS